jgi:adenylate cyclase
MDKTNNVSPAPTSDMVDELLTGDPTSSEIKSDEMIQLENELDQLVSEGVLEMYYDDDGERMYKHADVIEDVIDEDLTDEE